MIGVKRDLGHDMILIYCILDNTLKCLISRIAVVTDYLRTLFTYVFVECQFYKCDVLL